MTAAANRVQINVPTYMMVDGQWQIVLPGSVLDVPRGVTISQQSVLPTFTETPGTLAPHGQTTPVRNLRTR